MARKNTIRVDDILVIGIKPNMPSKILLVDDELYIEDLVRQKFRKQIKENQLEFEYVSNGKIALEN